MKTITYKGYEISPATEQLTDTDNWTLRVSILKHRDPLDVTNQQFFDAKNTFLSKEEAEIKSIEFGKDIIDGKLLNINVDEL